MKKLILIAAFTAACLPLFADAAEVIDINNSASVAAKYLDIAAGAAGAGMGNAYLGSAVDAEAVFWNPAGLNNMKRQDKDLSVYFSQNIWMLNTGMTNISAAKHIKKVGTFGLGISYFGAGEMDRSGITSSGNPIPMEGSFSPFALTASLSYANNMDQDTDFGVTLKYLLDSVDGSAAHAALFDVGARYHFRPLTGLSFSLSARNFGGTIGGNPVAKEVGFAALYAFSVEDFKFKIEYDACGKLSVPALHRAGLEAALPYLFTVRLGYQTDNTASTEGLKGLTAGLGVNLEGKKIDFAFEPYGEVGESYKLSFGGEF